jgi:diphosphoinositol-polyphosphate diphosphatase
MDVTEEMTEWPEQKKRTRRWMPAADAIEICKHDWMRDALRTWASTVPGLSSLVAI